MSTGESISNINLVVKASAKPGSVKLISGVSLTCSDIIANEVGNWALQVYIQIELRIWNLDHSAITSIEIIRANCNYLWPLSLQNIANCIMLKRLRWARRFYNQITILFNCKVLHLKIVTLKLIRKNSCTWKNLIVKIVNDVWAKLNEFCYFESSIGAFDISLFLLF